MSKSTKRARALQAKRQRKASMKPKLDANGNPIGQSTYAKKRRAGTVQGYRRIHVEGGPDVLEPMQPTVICGGCYLRHCQCAINAADNIRAIKRAEAA